MVSAALAWLGKWCRVQRGFMLGVLASWATLHSSIKAPDVCLASEGKRAKQTSALPEPPGPQNQTHLGSCVQVSAPLERSSHNPQKIEGSQQGSDEVPFA